jgi:hypothetical protein
MYHYGHGRGGVGASLAQAEDLTASNIRNQIPSETLDQPELMNEAADDPATRHEMAF